MWRTDGPTDRPRCRVACTRLRMNQGWFVLTIISTGCTRGTTPTPPITKQPQQRGASPSGTTTPTSLSAGTTASPNAAAGSNSNNAATEAAAQEQALLEAARRIEELQVCQPLKTMKIMTDQWSMDELDTQHNITPWETKHTEQSETFWTTKDRFYKVHSEQHILNIKRVKTLWITKDILNNNRHSE